jgi:diketogulonate reductase-like aldo/keto reductase
MTFGTLTPDGRARVLADGHQMPVLGLGVWQVPNGPDCVNAVRWALDLGYRHIDTAQAYGNEESVGRALRDSGVPREDVFITTKFAGSREDPVGEVEQSLKRLGLDWVNLYLVHWIAPGDRTVPVGPDRAAGRPAGGTPAQVLLRWCLQHDVVVIPKSTHRERIRENAQIFDFALSGEDMAELDGLDKTKGTDRAFERRWWAPLRRAAGRARRRLTHGLAASGS